MIPTTPETTLSADDQLVVDYIEPDPHRPGVTEARVKGRGVAVWAVIGRYLLTSGEDAVEDVAQAYQITPDAVRAVIAYYRRFRDELDARLAKLDAA